MRASSGNRHSHLDGRVRPLDRQSVIEQLLRRVKYEDISALPQLIGLGNVTRPPRSVGSPFDKEHPRQPTSAKCLIEDAESAIREKHQQHDEVASNRFL
jgi:hypothetical protein